MPISLKTILILIKKNLLGGPFGPPDPLGELVHPQTPPAKITLAQLILALSH